MKRISMITQNLNTMIFVCALIGIGIGITCVDATFITQKNIKNINKNKELFVPRKEIVEAFFLLNTGNFSFVSMRDVLNYTISHTMPDGRPQIDILSVSSVKIIGQYDNFTEPYIDMSPLKVTNPEEIALLKNKGIKVLLSVTGSGYYDENDGTGWGCILPEQNAAFIKWIDKVIIKEWGFNGIDIDDEYYACEPNDLYLNETIHALRNILGANVIIKKDLLNDANIIPMIKDVINYGSTMLYTNEYYWLIGIYEGYYDLGLRDDQILIGVQAGPLIPNNMNSFVNGFTGLETLANITKWKPSLNRTKGGITLFSFSQDTKQFTDFPQLVTPYPNKDDHLWQKTIIKHLNQQLN